jgi:hypothetical protein
MIRGMGHISNTPKQSLCQALNAQSLSLHVP